MKKEDQTTTDEKETPIESACGAATCSLLPCPFCGGKAIIKEAMPFGDKYDPEKEYPKGTFFLVRCSSAMSGDLPHCDIQPSTNGFWSIKEAAEVWNSRENDQEQRADQKPS